MAIFSKTVTLIFDLDIIMMLTLVIIEERVLPHEYVKYDSSITYYSKGKANVKVFADKQTDRRAKNYMPRSIDVGA